MIIPHECPTYLANSAASFLALSYCDATESPVETQVPFDPWTILLLLFRTARTSPSPLRCPAPEGLLVDPTTVAKDAPPVKVACPTPLCRSTLPMLLEAPPCMRACIFTALKRVCNGLEAKGHGASLDISRSVGGIGGKC